MTRPRADVDISGDSGSVVIEHDPAAVELIVTVNGQPPAPAPRTRWQAFREGWREGMAHDKATARPRSAPTPSGSGDWLWIAVAAFVFWC